MDVLAVGYGKIGRIKAEIWRSLGRRVIVSDTAHEAMITAHRNGYSLYDETTEFNKDLIVDISTPAGSHLTSLQKILESPLQPRMILIEKPIASSPAELESIVRLAGTGNARPEIPIVVNESYFQSSALASFARLVAAKGLHSANRLSIELSKNRLVDVVAGRFTDPWLGLFGIELPHMIAVLQSLGIELDDLVIKNVTHYQRVRPKHNEGFRAEMQYGTLPVVLSSFLGDFRIDEAGMFHSNKSVRSASINYNTNAYSVEFDPVQGRERYISVLSVFEKQRLVSSEQIADNHLRANLKYLHQNTIPAKNLLSLTDGLKATRFYL